MLCLCIPQGPPPSTYRDRPPTASSSSSNKHSSKNKPLLLPLTSLPFLSLCLHDSEDEERRLLTRFNPQRPRRTCDTSCFASPPKTDRTEQKSGITVTVGAGGSGPAAAADAGEARRVFHTGGAIHARGRQTRMFH